MSSCTCRVLRYTGLCGTLANEIVISEFSCTGLGRSACSKYLLQFSRAVLRETLQLHSNRVWVQESGEGKEHSGGPY